MHEPPRRRAGTVVADLAPVGPFVGSPHDHDGGGALAGAAVVRLGTIHGARLDLDDVREACLSLVQMSVADRRALLFRHPGRADVIGAGALILDRLVDLVPLSTDTMLVSEHDILDGIAWDIVS